MPAPTLGQRVLSRLVRKLGGVRTAAGRLDIPVDLLEAYLAAKRGIPERIWLQAVDMLMDDLTEVRRPDCNPKEDPKGTR
jgi:hypothetical protein